jgi:hypothetical protein
VRELVLGIPAGVQDPRQFLANLGVEPDQIEWILASISKHGCLFERWGVDPKVLALIKNLHASSWFSYGDIDSAIEVRVGGRQGCKFGATIFNSAYSIALFAIRDELSNAGIVVHLHSSA